MQSLSIATQRPLFIVFVLAKSGDVDLKVALDDALKQIKALPHRDEYREFDFVMEKPN